jgi:hypothetical protein
MSVEMGPLPEKTVKKDTFEKWDINPASAPIVNREYPNSKPAIKKDLFTSLRFSESSTIFKRTMSESDIISSQDISPEGEIAHLSHKDKVFRAMHGGSKPEMKTEDAEFDLEGLLDEDSGHEKDPEALAKKLGPELGMDLQPFRTADKGKEHIVLENKDGTKLVKVDKFSADDDTREDKAKAYRVVEELFPDRLPPSEPFKKAGETGVAVDKVKIHPKFEEARAAAKNGDPKLWNEITKNYFSDVLEELDEMGIDLWNSPSLDGDERDNYVTDIKGNQIFVDDIWLEGKDILTAKDNIIGRMRANQDKYVPDQQAKVLDAIKDLEHFTEEKNQAKTADKSTKRPLQHA